MTEITQTCTTCGKNFLIIPQEQEFLKKKGFPLPQLCPTDRQSRRLVTRGERTLYKSECQQCGSKTIISYDPKEVKNQILCKKCYLEFFEKNEIISA